MLSSLEVCAGAGGRGAPIGGNRMLSKIALIIYMALIAVCGSGYSPVKTDALDPSNITISVDSVRQEGDFLVVAGNVQNNAAVDLCFEGTARYPLSVYVTRLSDGAELLVSYVVEEFKEGRFWSHASKDLSPWSVFKVGQGQSFNFTAYREISDSDQFVEIKSGTATYVGTLAEVSSVKVQAGTTFSDCKKVTITGGFIEGPAKFEKSSESRLTRLDVN